MEIKEKIINTCRAYNARCYINLNKRDKEVIALQTLKLTAEFIASRQYDSIKNAYQKACGRHSAAGKEKRWILDIDNEEDDKRVINIKKHAKITTPNGHHYIISASKETASTELRDILLKDANTVLFAPSQLFIPSNN
jgi:hypothetical protein